MILGALKTDDAQAVELYSPGIEPRSGATNREVLRQWRLSMPADHFRAIGQKFKDAGVTIHSYTMNYRSDFTDEEIDATFDEAKALGTNIIASSTQVIMREAAADVRREAQDAAGVPRPFEYEGCE